jgi:hypothetical protein
LILHKNIEEALDRARIAIVPIPSSSNELTRWKMLLIDEKMRNETAFVVTDNVFIRWRVGF